MSSSCLPLRLLHYIALSIYLIISLHEKSFEEILLKITIQNVFSCDVGHPSKHFTCKKNNPKMLRLSHLFSFYLMHVLLV